MKEVEKTNDLDVHLKADIREMKTFLRINIQRIGKKKLFKLVQKEYTNNGFKRYDFHKPKPQRMSMLTVQSFIDIQRSYGKLNLFG